MRVISQSTSWPDPCVVTIGNFDGVHRGHQALIHRALTVARARQSPMVLLTFEPHPAKVLRGSLDHFLISPGQSKLDWLEQAGAEWVRILAFTQEFAAVGAEEFLDRVLAEELKAAHVVVGYNFSFGRGGLGNVALIDKWARPKGIGLDVLEPYRDPKTHDAVSSSLVRAVIREGDVERAERLLGHPFSVSNRGMPGDQRGRKLGAPTLNLVWPAEQVEIPYGVYAGMVRLGAGAAHPAIANFGVRPTFDGAGEPRLEIHLIGAQVGSPYGETVRFELTHRIRDERRFDSAEALKVQIQEDVKTAQRLLQGRR